MLTEAVRRRPYQVILFDEVEKAHEDVFNILLQVLDDGRLTDGQGRTVDFKNTIIVLTSNLGSEILAAQPEGEPAAMVQGQVMRIVRAHFRPEFLNRLDEIILFRRLQRSDMAAIVSIQLEHLRKLLADRKIGLDLDRSALEWLASEGYDSTYGARPLKRVIQEDRTAAFILRGLQPCHRPPQYLGQSVRGVPRRAAPARNSLTCSISTSLNRTPVGASCFRERVPSTQAPLVTNSPGVGKTVRGRCLQPSWPPHGLGHDEPRRARRGVQQLGRGAEQRRSSTRRARRPPRRSARRIRAIWTCAMARGSATPGTCSRRPIRTRPASCSSMAATGSATARTQFANLIAGPYAHGWAAALPGYTLAPDASLTEIVAEINAALDWLAAHGPAHGIAGKVVLSGLVGRRPSDGDVPGHQRVSAGLAISGIYELGPIRDT